MKEHPMSVAQIILAQLGGNRFVAMTGAKGFASAPRTLVFSIGRNASRANRVRITLTGRDDYDVEFSRYANYEQKTLKTFEGVYADQLRAIFSEFTGMALSL
jgi:hypothetical protein